MALLSAQAMDAAQIAKPTFTDAHHERTKRIALARPEDYGQPSSTWSLAELADFLVDKGVVEDISHDRLRRMLRQQGVSFQRVETWKESTSPTMRARSWRVRKPLPQAASSQRP
jgi:transposase